MRSIVFEGDTWERYEELRRKEPRLHRTLRRQLAEMRRGDPDRRPLRPSILSDPLRPLRAFTE
jgi:toxin YoeB